MRHALSTPTPAGEPRTARVAPALIAWHERHGRHDLPWQLERTPYRVWVSEIMLQQTQVGTVLLYYPRFVQRFASVAALAGAPLDEVLHLWSGLGYYARARNLHRAAQQIVREHDGEVPRELQLLMGLPGIGRSTAAAIIALAYGGRAAILDGNVKRVMSRLFAIASPPGGRSTEQLLWHCAEQCTPEAEVAAYTQAIMDLGATVCIRSQPQCSCCPLRPECIAYRTDQVQRLPLPRQRAPRPLRRTVLLLALRSDGAVLLRRRPESGVWAGLWTPPEFSSAEAAAQFCSTELQGAQPLSQPLPLVRHRFTHFDLEIIPVRTTCAGALPVVSDRDDALWYRSCAPAAIGVPAPIAALINQLRAQEPQVCTRSMAR
jgi:A/G-specific adenine glycosylase